MWVNDRAEKELKKVKWDILKKIGWSDFKIQWGLDINPVVRKQSVIKTKV
jgi:hypothetical protein